MSIRVFLLGAILSLFGSEAWAWSISLPPKTKELSEHLINCEPYEYKSDSSAGIDLQINGRENDLCSIHIQTADMHLQCALSDFNLEELRLTFEQVTINVTDLEKSYDNGVFSELFSGFISHNLCNKEK